jgi:predicted outer membrane repeat protein
MTITNSTVSGNTASKSGGGIDARGPVMIANSTVSENTASVSGGGISNHLGSLTLANSVVQGACEGEYYYSDGYNVESPDDTCGFNRASDQVSVSADELKLGQLADNGGPTETKALLPGSVAIDVIPPKMCEVEEDQRGVARPQGPACDVGAFELEVVP